MSTSASTQTQTLRIAVVNAASIAEEAAESGAEIITEANFREAVSRVNRALNSGEHIDAIIVGDAQAVGLRSWVNHIRQDDNAPPIVVVRSFEGIEGIDDVAQVGLPRALDEVLRISGADVSTNTFTMLNPDPEAPKPQSPSRFPAVVGSGPPTQQRGAMHDPETTQPGQAMPVKPESQPAAEPESPGLPTQQPPAQVDPVQQMPDPQPMPQPVQRAEPQPEAYPMQPQYGQPMQPPAPQVQSHPQSYPSQPMQYPSQPQFDPSQPWPQAQSTPPWQQAQQQFVSPSSQIPPWQQVQQPQGQWVQPLQHPPQYQAQPQQPVPQPARQPNRAPGEDMFFTASSSQALAPIIVVGAYKGGVGKTSVSIGLAQRAAAKGLKVVLVDANMGQGGSVSVRLLIHRADGLPTIYDAAMTNDPVRGFVPPDEINQVRNQFGRLDEVGFSLVQAPTAETSSRDVVTNEIYLDVIRYAQRQADLVVIDTQIIEAEAHRPDSLFWERLVPMLRRSEAWFVGVTEDDRESVKNTLAICRTLAEQKEVPRPRMLTIFNLFDPGIVDPRSAYNSMKSHSVPVGVIDRVDAIKKRFSNGFTPASIPQFLPVLDNILLKVTGEDDLFIPRETAQLTEQTQRRPKSKKPERKEKKPGFFARLFGRK